MSRRVLIAALLVGACASTVQLQRYRALSPEAQDTYDKYRQFFTEHQRDTYLALPNDQERRDFIRDLHIEERIAKFPPFIQAGIWSRQVVPGMDKEAVFLTWGKPDEVEHTTYEESHGVEQETWIYKRGAGNSENYLVVITTGQVVEVRAPPPTTK